MNLHELFTQGYGWLTAHGDALLLGAIALPVLGTVAARLGKAGRTDADGRFIASGVVGLALTACLIEALFLLTAQAGLGMSLLDLDLRVIFAPLVCLVGCLLGIRWVFPLSELGSWRMFGDVGMFVGAAALVVWLGSKFRGWGIFFAGGLGELVLLGVISIALLRRLWQRATRRVS